MDHYTLWAVVSFINVWSPLKWFLSIFWNFADCLYSILQSNLSVYNCSLHILHFSHVMKNLFYVICEQQRRRSACTSVQSDQHLNRSLSGLCNTLLYPEFQDSRDSLCRWAGRFETNLIANHGDRFSRDVAHFVLQYYDVRIIMGTFSSTDAPIVFCEVSLFRDCL